MIKEVKATMEQNLITATANISLSNGIQNCENAINLKLLNLLNNVKLTCSYDMAWQKRAGGRIYDSLSGHGFIIGVIIRKIVG